MNPLNRLSKKLEECRIWRSSSCHQDE